MGVLRGLVSAPGWGGWWAVCFDPVFGWSPRAGGGARLFASSCGSARWRSAVVVAGLGRIVIHTKRVDEMAACYLRYSGFSGQTRDR